MDKRVKEAVEAAVKQYEETGNTGPSGFYELLLPVFDSDHAFMEKVAGLDDAFAANPDFEPLREVFFDLLLINFFTEDINKLEKDYLESEDWEAIEEDTLDRGTELLNLLLYLKECHDEEIEPELDDYLKEFLLVDEDEFQDEHRIYEDVIANQVMVESPVGEIAKVSAGLSEKSEFKELFYPVMCFFQNQQPADSEFDDFISHSAEPGFDAAAYRLLVTYNQK